MGSLDQVSKDLGNQPSSDTGFVPPKDAVDITPKKDGGVLKVIKKEGTGEQTPPNGCKVIVHYEGRLTDGTVFDSSKERAPFDFNLGKGMNDFCNISKMIKFVTFLDFGLNIC